MLAGELDDLVDQRSRLDDVRQEPPGPSEDASSRAAGEMDGRPPAVLWLSTEPGTNERVTQLARARSWPTRLERQAGRARRRLGARSARRGRRHRRATQSAVRRANPTARGVAEGHADRVGSRSDTGRWGLRAPTWIARPPACTRLIESRREVAEQELGAARETGSSFDARGLEKKVHELRQQEQQLRDDRLHLDQHLEPHQLVRAAAYTREHAIRREIELDQHADRPMTNPPARGEDLRQAIEQLSAGLPEKWAADRAEWQAIAGRLEALDERIQRLRTETDLEPPTSEPLHTSGTEGPDLELS